MGLKVKDGGRVAAGVDGGTVEALTVTVCGGTNMYGMSLIVSALMIVAEGPTVVPKAPL